MNVNSMAPHPTSSSSPPSSTQSTPTKKPFVPSYGAYSGRNQSSPTRGSSGVGGRRPFGSYHNHYSSGPLNHRTSAHLQSGSFSPPFYKTQSWVNLSQTPPPPPPPTQAHLPLLSSAGFIYSPTAPPHYSHSQMPPQFTRSPPTMAPQKFKWNSNSYPRNDRHQWFGHRALARV